MAKVKIPRDFKSRLAEAGKKHDFSSAQEFADHLVGRALPQYGVPDDITKLKKQLDWVVEEHGYSDRKELIVHLLERGLRAYEEPAEDPAALENRLRGLGYIE